MKKVFAISVTMLLLLGCAMNPSKEARIQKLETELVQSIDKINELEKRIISLEEVNVALQIRLSALEKQ